MWVNDSVRKTFYAKVLKVASTGWLRTSWWRMIASKNSVCANVEHWGSFWPFEINFGSQKDIKRVRIFVLVYDADVSLFLQMSVPYLPRVRKKEENRSVLFKKTRGPQTLTVTWVSETLHQLLIRRAHICISTSPSQNKWKSKIE